MKPPVTLSPMTVGPSAQRRGLHPIGFAFLLLVCVANAGPRSSASYSITTDSDDAGGTRATSASYTNDGSVGNVAGLSTVASPVEFAKSGYIGQLYEVTGLTLSTTSGTLNETTGTVQLGASESLDDGSIIVLAANTLTWSIQSGPITSISSGGLATAGTVYQDSAATVQGSFAGNSGALNLTVVNVNPDDFGIYAGDGLPDSWQVQYFGVNNPNAAPNATSDGSGLTNLFKYTAGLIPNAAASTFTLSVNPVIGQPTQMNIVFSPSLTTRHYTILSSTDLLAWSTLTGPFTGNGSTQTVNDPSAGTAPKFYRVQVTNP